MIAADNPRMEKTQRPANLIIVETERYPESTRINRVFVRHPEEPNASPWWMSRIDLVQYMSRGGTVEDSEGKKLSLCPASNEPYNNDPDRWWIKYGDRRSLAETDRRDDL